MSDIWRGFRDAIQNMTLPFAVSYGAILVVTLNYWLALWIAAVVAVIALAVCATERPEATP